MKNRTTDEEQWGRSVLPSMSVTRANRVTENKPNTIKQKKKILFSTLLIAITAFCLIAVMPTATTSEAADPTIVVTAVGLDNLKVGVPVPTDCGIVYTLTDGTFVSTLQHEDFKVTGLPAGLSVVESHLNLITQIMTLKIAGTPTTANSSSVSLGYSASIPGSATTSGKTIVPTGTITAGPVAKGDGAAVSGAPSANGTPTDTSITVKEVKIPVNIPYNQRVEYAISMNGGTTPATGWQTGTTFSSLSPATTYYIYARSAANSNYDAGPAESAGISTSLTAVTFTPTQTGGTSGTTNSMGIVLTFTKAVKGLTASDITITNGTGAVAAGDVTGGGSIWTIALFSVTTEGNVTVEVTDFGTFNVTGGIKTVMVYAAAEPKTYETKDGAGGRWTIGSNSGLGVTVGAPSSIVTGVSVDNEYVAAGNYTVANNASGDAVVTLKAAFLETLTEGSHTVKIVMNDGSVSTTMKVTAADAGGVGGSSTMLIAVVVIIAVLAIAVVAYMFVIKPKTK